MEMTDCVSWKWIDEFEGAKQVNPVEDAKEVTWLRKSSRQFKLKIMEPGEAAWVPQKIISN